MDVRGETQEPVPGKKPLLPTEQEAGVGRHILSECFIEQKDSLSSPVTITTQSRPDTVAYWGDGVFKPPLRNSEGPPKSCQTQPDL